MGLFYFIRLAGWLVSEAPVAILIVVLVAVEWARKNSGDLLLVILLLLSVAALAISLSTLGGWNIACALYEYHCMTPPTLMEYLHERY